MLAVPKLIDVYRYQVARSDVDIHSPSFLMRTYGYEGRPGSRWLTRPSGAVLAHRVPADPNFSWVFLLEVSLALELTYRL